MHKSVSSNAPSPQQTGVYRLYIAFHIHPLFAALQFLRRPMTVYFYDSGGEISFVSMHAHLFFAIVLFTTGKRNIFDSFNLHISDLILI